MAGEWKTLRVRAATLDAVKARAAAAGTNATAWADSVLLAAVAGRTLGDVVTAPPAVSAGVSTVPTGSPVADVRRASSAAAKAGVKPIPKGGK